MRETPLAGGVTQETLETTDVGIVASALPDGKRIAAARVRSTGKSTSSEAQRQRVLEALRQRPQTTHDLRCLGIYQAPARIMELRRRGYAVVTERVTLYDRDGYAHRGAARYHLEGPK
ncbi:MAG: helix-turn-helix domain-containing protein [Hydrogenophaga sp.]|nr:helix-turn-helix domain-containing protein [Hydrogenophaga sp.]